MGVSCMNNRYDILPRIIWCPWKISLISICHTMSQTRYSLHICRISDFLCRPQFSKCRCCRWKITPFLFVDIIIIIFIKHIGGDFRWFSLAARRRFLWRNNLINLFINATLHTIFLLTNYDILILTHTHVIIFDE